MHTSKTLLQVSIEMSNHTPVKLCLKATHATLCKADQIKAFAPGVHILNCSARSQDDERLPRLQRSLFTLVHRRLSAIDQ